jgi:hypothetical protein
MRICTLLAALLVLGNWTFVAGGQALAHGGTDFAVLDCEDEECEDSARVFDCEDEECEGDEIAAVLECHDDEEDQE